MAEPLLVVINGRLVGHVQQDAAGRLTFSYAEEWAADPAAIALSASLPLSRRRHDDRAVRNYLNGLLPDNDDVREAWGRRFQVSARNPYALLGYVGLDIAGAAQFVPESQYGSLQREVKIDWISEAEIAEHLRRLRSGSTEWNVPRHEGRFSLAGAQSKFTVVREGGRWGIPIGAAASTHIVKPGIRGLPESDLGEHLTMDAARRAGMVVARTEYRQFEDQGALVVTRFDRVQRASGGILRLHTEDLCQALGVDPARKYQNDGGPGVVDIVRLLRRATPADTSDVDVWRLIDAVIANWLLGATDAHAKNYALVSARGRARLAPLYDLQSAVTYRDVFAARSARLAMSIGGEYVMRHIEVRHWERLATAVGVNALDVLERIDDLRARLLDAVRDDSVDDNLPVAQRAFAARWRADVSAWITSTGAGGVKSAM
ncbi:type II toxin-antitoxin system HipA family toxin [Microbacterium sp.]|uniref:type II toxin-antitoxin system HipA family toxin n=1 Tax=Microbacterium sp. TaxID=51671 RepID=UPI003C748B33